MIGNEIADEQRRLRLFIQQLKPSALSAAEGDATLRARVGALERVMSLDGRLAVESSEHGARVQISLPVPVASR